ncbi:MAG: hypothetical protein OXQ29_06670 [Rhodospirillaceae bacterium]|nr:hypothetical protein [Rhodospirillaceae bacterium]
MKTLKELEREIAELRAEVARLRLQMLVAHGPRVKIHPPVFVPATTPNPSGDPLPGSPGHFMTS